MMLAGFLFGTFGMGYFIYGKKRGAAVPLACGLILMIYPYFVTNIWINVGIGLLLMALPFFVKR